MAQSKHEIQALLAEAGTSPRHRFGQNFMIDANLVRLVADAGEVTAADALVEVGPGTGTLTEELLARGPARLAAVEIDRDLAGLLRQRLGGRAGFQLIEADALAGKHDLGAELARFIADARAAGHRLKLVANLPYNIASPLVVELLIAGAELLAFTVQREVADRLRAAPGTEAYGGLTVMVQLLADVEVLRTLPPQAFWPAPKVDSALVRLRRRDRLGELARPFGAFLAALFSARRKTLRKALDQAACDPDATLAAAALDGASRAEQLPPDRLLTLFTHARPTSDK